MQTGWLDKQMSDLGFSIPGPSAERRLVIASGMKEKGGKTHFGMTAPPPIGVVSIDQGTKEIVEKFIAMGKKIALCRIKTPPLVALLRKDKDRIDKSWIMEHAEEEWEKAKRAIIAIIENPAFRTFIGDTATEFYELCRLARHGKLAQVMPHHYGPLNAEFRELVKRAAEREDLNCIWIHKRRKVYKENAKGESNWTGEWERSGFADLAYLADVNLENYYDYEQQVFGAKMLDCRQNPACIGQEFEGEFCNFTAVACSVFPDTKPSYWS
jgi:hypothetical protein